MSAEDLMVIMQDKNIKEEWGQISTKLGQFNIPDGTGGVNPGDRRAIYHLVRSFKPKAVLEIGTHIGASTVHIASALREVNEEIGLQGTLTSVDIKDVNSESTRPWEEYGMQNSPKNMISQLDLGGYVEFKVSSSIEFVRKNRQKFDFIFLDGDHSAETVNQEICLLPELLAEDGVVLLHDYFPDKKPLWSNNVTIDGPFLAVEELVDKKVPLKVLPLGELPWPTKLNSNITSLALFTRN